MSRFLIVNFLGITDAREKGRELRIVETPLSADGAKPTVVVPHDSSLPQLPLCFCLLY